MMKKLTLILIAMLISSVVQIPLSSAATDNARITGIEISGKQGTIIWGTHEIKIEYGDGFVTYTCLLYTSPSPRDVEESRMPSSA